MEIVPVTHLRVWPASSSIILPKITRGFMDVNLWLVFPDDPNQAPIIDLVQLLLVGMYLKWKGPG